MELLDRYLAAVGAYLPHKQRPDILAEMRDALLSRFEERQVAVGHPLTSEDTEAVLKAYGHPVAVAIPYRRQRPLIGAALLPWYWLAVRVALGVSWIVDLVLGGIGFASGESASRVLSHLAVVLWSSTVQAVGAVTLIAVVLDRLGAERWLALWFGRITESWRPRDLPQLPPAPRVPTPNWAVAWDLIGIGLIVLWMSGAVDSLVAPISGVTHLRPAAIVFALRWPVLLIVIAQTAVHVMWAMRPGPTVVRTALSLAAKVAVLMVLFILLRHWPLWQIVNLPPRVAVGLARGLNIGFGLACGVLTLVTVIALLWDLAQLRQLRR